SVLTFLLFESIPNGDPARRLAGRLATANEIAFIRHEYGFDQPIYVQYARMMKNIFTGQAFSYYQGFNVVDEVKAGLPATFTLSVLFIGFYSRVLRSTILDTINEDYVRTARAKGLSENQTLRRHVLRNSLIPIISLFGLDFAQVIGGGAILTESIFNLHGVG